MADTSTTPPVTDRRRTSWAHLLVYWRTMLILAFLALVLLTAMLYCLRSERGPSIFSDFKTAIEVLAGLAVTKSSIEHVSNASGVAGAGKVLLTGQPSGTPTPALSETPKVVQ